MKTVALPVAKRTGAKTTAKPSAAAHPADMSAETTARIRGCISQIRQQCTKLRAIEHEMRGGGHASDAVFQLRATLLGAQVLERVVSAKLDPRARYRMGGALANVASTLISATENVRAMPSDAVGRDEQEAPASKVARRYPEAAAIGLYDPWPGATLERASVAEMLAQAVSPHGDEMLESGIAHVADELEILHTALEGPAPGDDEVAARVVHGLARRLRVLGEIARRTKAVAS